VLRRLGESAHGTRLTFNSDALPPLLDLVEGTINLRLTIHKPVLTPRQIGLVLTAAGDVTARRFVQVVTATLLRHAIAAGFVVSTEAIFATERRHAENARRLAGDAERIVVHGCAPGLRWDTR